MLPEDTGEKGPAPERRPDGKNKEVSLMKKWKMVLTAAMPLTMALSFPAFAGEWQEDMNGWKYRMMTVPTVETAGTGWMVIMTAGHSAIISEIPDMR